MFLASILLLVALLRCQATMWSFHRQQRPAQVEVWPGSGHHPHLVDPERFLARMIPFLG